jgi:hypothetical protein
MIKIEDGEQFNARDGISWMLLARDETRSDKTARLIESQRSILDYRLERDATVRRLRASCVRA